MIFSRDQLSLYLVMGTANCLKSPEIVLEEAIRGGVTIFQFRETGKDCLQGEARYELAKNLQVICKKNKIPFIVNDDVELAMILDADGVHVGQEDGNIAEIRKVIGNKILGISTHHLEEARNAVELGADYIGVGPMFMTKTKEDIQEVRGSIVIEEMRDFGIKLPVVGIGGITEQNLGEVMNAGADGVAVISAITRHKNTQEAARTLSNQIMTQVALKST